MPCALVSALKMDGLTTEILQGITLATGIGGQLLLSRKNIGAFYLWIVSNIALISLSIMNQQYGITFLYAFYTFMCLYSIRSWRKMDESDELYPTAEESARAG